MSEKFSQLAKVASWFFCCKLGGYKHVALIGL